MRETITSLDNPTVGGGTVLNECRFVYNDFGQLVTEYQSHAGTVNVSTTPQVGYQYADGSDHTIRPTGLVYPNGRVLTYHYGLAGSVSDRASRIASIIDDDNTPLVDYTYLGQGTFVAQDDPEPGMTWTLIDLAGSNDPDTGDIYTGFDRFGRVKDNRWYNYNAEEDVDRIQYGYDRASNRIWRRNTVAAALEKAFDEIYSYDGIHRLKDMARGLLEFSGSQPSTLNSQQFRQCWTLDSTGNWNGFRESDDGSAWSLVQQRSANPVNEISGITNSIGASWAQPEYSRAGNMTTMPQPADPTLAYTATYDAWNRLVQLTDASSEGVVSQYQYDGAKRRIVQLNYEDGSLAETRHLYYTEPSKWQVVEERLGTSPDAANPDRQFVWGLRYIDDCILRDRHVATSSSSSFGGESLLKERLYACQDANWNATAIIAPLSEVQERYSYSPYGASAFLTATFDSRAASDFDWETLYCGYRYETRTGLYQVRNRVIHSVAGTWIQRDPAGYADGSSLYSTYNTLNHTDALGLKGGRYPVCCSWSRRCEGCLRDYTESQRGTYACDIRTTFRINPINGRREPNPTACCFSHMPTTTTWYCQAYGFDGATNGLCNQPPGLSGCSAELMVYLKSSESDPDGPLTFVHCASYCECLFGKKTPGANICMDLLC